MTPAAPSAAPHAAPHVADTAAAAAGVVDALLDDAACAVGVAALHSGAQKKSAAPTTLKDHLSAFAIFSPLFKLLRADPQEGPVFYPTC